MPFQLLSIRRALAQDALLRRVLKNSSYLFSSSAAALVLSLLQGILAARLLGAEMYGVLAGVVIPLTSNVNRLFSFRMSEVAVRYLGDNLAGSPNESGQAAAERVGRAAQLVRQMAVTEALTSLGAFAALCLFAPWAARWFADDSALGWLFMVYGLALLGNLVYETSLGVLQVTNRFNRLAQVNLIQNLITTAGLITAFVLLPGQPLVWVLLAYLLGKVFAGLAVALLAWRGLTLRLGWGWWSARQPPGAAAPELPTLRGALRFALSTNLQSTLNLVARDSETLFISLLRSSTEAGYYRIALGLINLVMLPMEPLISTIYAEIARSIRQRAWLPTRLLLKRVTWIAGGWTLAAAAALALPGSRLIALLYGAEYIPAYPALLILLVGYGAANMLNWNRSLLLALGNPTYPLKVAAVGASIKLVLTVLLLPALGYLFQAALMSAYLVSTVLWITRYGLRQLDQAARAAPV